jgi:DNA-directed RNA polymerase subunit RPC12/RpoP
MGHDIKVKTTVTPNVRCLNCGKKWHSKNKKHPKFCQHCRSTKIEKYNELRELKKQIKGTNQKNFPYRPNWGKPLKSVK